MAAKIGIQEQNRPARGVFSIRVKDRAGNTVYEDSDRNMIVNLARVALATLVSEGRYEKVVTKFGVGVGTENAAPTDTDLVEPYMNRVTGHEFPIEGTVKFKWFLDYEEANGRDISEFGLFCEDGTLFAHKVRRPIFKDDDIAFEGEWSIIF